MKACCPSITTGKKKDKNGKETFGFNDVTQYFVLC